MPRTSTTLVCTDIPGVFRNRGGVLVDERGVALSFAKLKSADDERWTEVLGAPPTSPAELLKGIALDPRHHLDVRMAAARQAAPYYDARMPIRLEGQVNTGGNSIDMAKLARMPKSDRETLLSLLKSVGATV